MNICISHCHSDGDKAIASSIKKRLSLSYPSHKVIETLGPNEFLSISSSSSKIAQILSCSIDSSLICIVIFSSSYLKTINNFTLPVKELLRACELNIPIYLIINTIDPNNKSVILSSIENRLSSLSSIFNSLLDTTILCLPSLLSNSSIISKSKFNAIQHLLSDGRLNGFETYYTHSITIKFDQWIDPLGEVQVLNKLLVAYLIDQTRKDLSTILDSSIVGSLTEDSMIDFFYYLVDEPPSTQLKVLNYVTPFVHSMNLITPSLTSESSLTLSFQPQNTSWQNVLGAVKSSFQFDSFIKERTTDFVGRSWLFDRIFAHLDDQDGFQRKLMLILGEAGVGKSAVLCKLISDSSVSRGRVIASHICSFRIPSSLLPDLFAKSIVGQLLNWVLAHSPEKMSLIPQEAIDNIVELRNGSNVVACLENFFIALNKAVPNSKDGKKGLIIVDSLDEALEGFDAHLGIPLLISKMSKSKSVPKWIKFLSSSRFSSHLTTNLLSGLEPYDEIQASSDDNMVDIWNYVVDKVDRIPRFGSALDSSLDRSDVETKIVELSQGNFMYARCVMEKLTLEEEVKEALARKADGSKLKLEDIEKLLPDNLNDYYQEMLYRALGSVDSSTSLPYISPEDWTLVGAPLFTVLTAIQRPITMETLRRAVPTAAWLRVNELLSHHRLAGLVCLPTTKPIFNGRDQGRGEVMLQIHHKSFTDFLSEYGVSVRADEKTKTEYKIKVSIRDGHKLLASISIPSFVAMLEPMSLKTASKGKEKVSVTPQTRNPPQQRGSSSSTLSSITDGIGSISIGSKSWSLLDFGAASGYSSSSESEYESEDDSISGGSHGAHGAKLIAQDYFTSSAFAHMMAAQLYSWTMDYLLLNYQWIKYQLQQQNGHSRLLTLLSSFFSTIAGRVSYTDPRIIAIRTVRSFLGRYPDLAQCSAADLDAKLKFYVTLQFATPLSSVQTHIRNERKKNKSHDSNNNNNNHNNNHNHNDNNDNNDSEPRLLLADFAQQALTDLHPARSQLGLIRDGLDTIDSSVVYTIEHSSSRAKVHTMLTMGHNNELLLTASSPKDTPNPLYFSVWDSSSGRFEATSLEVMISAPIVKLDTHRFIASNVTGKFLEVWSINSSTFNLEYLKRSSILPARVSRVIPIDVTTIVFVTDEGDLGCFNPSTGLISLSTLPKLRVQGSDLFWANHKNSFMSNSVYHLFYFSYHSGSIQRFIVKPDSTIPSILCDNENLPIPFSWMINFTGAVQHPTRPRSMIVCGMKSSGLSYAEYPSLFTIEYGSTTPHSPGKGRSSSPFSSFAATPVEGLCFIAAGANSWQNPSTHLQADDETIMLPSTISETLLSKHSENEYGRDGEEVRDEAFESFDKESDFLSRVRTVSYPRGRSAEPLALRLVGDHLVVQFSTHYSIFSTHYDWITDLLPGPEYLSFTCTPDLLIVGPRPRANEGGITGSSVHFRRAFKPGISAYELVSPISYKKKRTNDYLSYPHYRYNEHMYNHHAYSHYHSTNNGLGIPNLLCTREIPGALPEFVVIEPDRAHSQVNVRTFFTKPGSNYPEGSTNSFVFRSSSLYHKCSFGFLSSSFEVLDTDHLIFLVSAPDSFLFHKNCPLYKNSSPSVAASSGPMNMSRLPRFDPIGAVNPTVPKDTVVSSSVQNYLIVYRRSLNRVTSAICVGRARNFILTRDKSWVVTDTLNVYSVSSYVNKPYFIPQKQRTQTSTSKSSSSSSPPPSSPPPSSPPPSSSNFSYGGSDFIVHSDKIEVRYTVESYMSEIDTPGYMLNWKYSISSLAQFKKLVSKENLDRKLTEMEGGVIAFDNPNSLDLQFFDIVNCKSLGSISGLRNANPSSVQSTNYYQPDTLIYNSKSRILASLHSERLIELYYKASGARKTITINFPEESTSKNLTCINWIGSYELVGVSQTNELFHIDTRTSKVLCLTIDAKANASNSALYWSKEHNILVSSCIVPANNRSRSVYFFSTHKK